MFKIYDRLIWVKIVWKVGVLINSIVFNTIRVMVRLKRNELLIKIIFKLKFVINKKSLWNIKKLDRRYSGYKLIKELYMYLFKYLHIYQQTF